ncbi:MAG TPA: lipocalin-like domain-containing protein [Gemmatimonadales bacterium]
MRSERRHDQAARAADRRRMVRTPLAVVGVALASAAAAAGPGPGGAAASTSWAAADPAHVWAFPRDHHAHPEFRNEWWYLTGTLETEGEPVRRLGYQLTFFRVGLLSRAPALDSSWSTGAAVMAHLAVTDVAAGTHAFAEVLWRAMPLLGGFGGPADPVLAWAVSPPGTGGRWALRLDRGVFALSARDEATGIGVDLTATPARPLVLQGPNGYSRKATQPGFASLYYSFTRMATAGTITVGGRTYRVRGTSWMDRELGSSQLAPEQVGWDWWSLRLADGRDLMLYLLRRADGAVDFRRATLVERDGRPRYLAAQAWTVSPLGRWRSETSDAEYPSGWAVSIPESGIRITVEPELRAAENVSRRVPGLSYWEGPVRIIGPDGKPAGDGYAELTGYGKRTRPPI